MSICRVYSGLESGIERLEELAEQSVFERPDCFLSELLVGGRDEVFPVNCSKELHGKLLFHELPINQGLGFDAVERVSAPELDGFTKRLPAPLNSVNAHRDGFDQIKVLGVLSEERLEVTEATAYPYLVAPPF